MFAPIVALDISEVKDQVIREIKKTNKPNLICKNEV